MRPSLAFAGLVVPYVVIVAACIVVGAAFVAPDATFETVGSGGVSSRSSSAPPRCSRRSGRTGP